MYKLATLIEGDPKVPFSIATTLQCKGEESTTLFHLMLDPYLIMPSAKQGSIKYNVFFNLLYDSTWDWSPGPLANTTH